MLFLLPPAYLLLTVFFRTPKFLHWGCMLLAPLLYVLQPALYDFYDEGKYQGGTFAIAMTLVMLTFALRYIRQEWLHKTVMVVCILCNIPLILALIVGVTIGLRS